MMQNALAHSLASRTDFPHIREMAKGLDWSYALGFPISYDAKKADMLKFERAIKDVAAQYGEDVALALYNDLAPRPLPLTTLREWAGQKVLL